MPEWGRTGLSRKSRCVTSSGNERTTVSSAGSSALDVGERVLDLERVVEADVELLPEGAVDADGHLDLAVADDRGVAGGSTSTSSGKTLNSRPDEAGRARLEEAGLPQLRLEPLLGQGLDGPLEVVDADRVEDDAGLEGRREVAQAAEEVVVLPPRDQVQRPS